MKREEIKDRVDVLKKEINTRQNEVDRLNKGLMDTSDNFRDKFIIWASVGKAEQLSSLPGGDLRAYADDHGWIEGRGVINILEYEDFELYAFPETESYFDNAEDAKKEIERLESDELFINACKHMVRDNFDSFAIDW